MIPSTGYPLPSETLPEVQAIRDLLARSVAFRNAAIAEPVLGPGGAVILDVRCEQRTTFRVVAPTATEAYALLHELIAPLVHPTQRGQRNSIIPPMATDREEPLSLGCAVMPGGPQRGNSQKSPDTSDHCGAQPRRS